MYTQNIEWTVISVCMEWSKLILSQYHPVHWSRVKRTNDVQNYGRQTKAYEREVHKITMEKKYMNQVEENIAQSIKHLKCFESYYADSWEKKKKYIKKEEVTRILTWILILIQNDLISYHRCNTCASFIAVAKHDSIFILFYSFFCCVWSHPSTFLWYRFTHTLAKYGKKLSKNRLNRARIAADFLFLPMRLPKKK